jgi:transposase
MISWAPSQKPLSAQYRWTPGKYVASMAAISVDHGLEQVRFVEGSGFKKPDFIEFLKDLQLKWPKRKILIFVDNCGIHKKGTVATYLKECKKDLKLLYNAPYRPDLMGVELYWREAKSHYRREVVNRVATWSPIDNISIVREALKQIPRKNAIEFAV